MLVTDQEAALGKGRQVFDDIHDSRELIAVAVGAGSVCWDRTGVFDSTRAAEVSEAAYQRLQTIIAGSFAPPTAGEGETGE